MSLVDLGIVGLAAIGAWIGWRRGVWWLCYWSGGILLTLFLSVYVHRPLYVHFRRNFRPWASTLLGFTTIGTVVLMVLWFLWAPLQRRISLSKADRMNRLLGVPAGAAVGVLVGGLLALHGLRSGGPGLQDSVRGSALASLTFAPLRAASFLLPQRYRSALEGPAPAPPAGL